MKRVTGIGGIFFKCEDVKAQKEWYQQHLGIPPVSDEGGGMFVWREKDAPEQIGITAWSPFKKDSNYFAPSEKPFMFNYRVENLAALLEELKKEGVQIVGAMEEYSYGKFGWIMDPEGNKIELWEPIDEEPKENPK